MLDLVSKPRPWMLGADPGPVLPPPHLWLRSQATTFFFFFKILLILKKKDFTYLFMTDTHRERHKHRQREKQAPCRDPDAGLDPRTPGSHPGPKADAQPLSHPGVPQATTSVCGTLRSSLCQAVLSAAGTQIHKHNGVVKVGQGSINPLFLHYF